MTEFTGERVIPGQVEDDLWAEHLARYAFAARFASGKRVLDIGCGTGYGTEELARTAAAATGIDSSVEAIAYAAEHYPDVRFEIHSATDLSFEPGSFDLITAFEIIEHLPDWRALLSTAHRLLAPGGLFIVSTPNKHYYAEARAASGPNPYHTHEFEYGEFRNALSEYFPHTRTLLQDRLESFAFYDAQALIDVDTQIRRAAGDPSEANFYVGLCSMEPLPPIQAFLYVPSAVNLLRQREQHIRKLEGEIGKLRGWLDDANQARDKSLANYAALEKHVEDQNQWSLQLEKNLKAAQARIAQAQDEFHAEQARAQAIVEDLNQQLRRQTEEAQQVHQRMTEECEQHSKELVEAVKLLDRAEATVIERTKWAQRLDAQLTAVQQSRWVKIGRRLHLGPGLEPDASQSSGEQ